MAALAEKEPEIVDESDVVVENWSGTHSFSPSAYFQPESPDAVQRILDLMHEVGGRLRVVGSALSPNGIGLSDEPMLNMAMCGSVLKVDKEKKQVAMKVANTNCLDDLIDDALLLLFLLLDCRICIKRRCNSQTCCACVHAAIHYLHTACTAPWLLEKGSNHI